MELVLNFFAEKHQFKNEVSEENIFIFDNKFIELKDNIKPNNYIKLIDIYKKSTFNKINQWEFILENLTENNEDFSEFYNMFFNHYDIDFSRVIFFELYKFIHINYIT